MRWMSNERAAVPPTPSPTGQESPTDQIDARGKRIVDRARAAGETVPTDEHAQIDWLNEATTSDPAGRYLTEVWRERTDLWETFPGMFLDPDAAQRFRLWAHHFAATECHAPAELIPAAPVGITDLIAPPPTGPTPTLTSGVQLYGYLRATLGLGEAARRVVSLLALANEPTLARSYDHIGSPLAYPWPDPSAPPTTPRDAIRNGDREDSARSDQPIETGSTATRATTSAATPAPTPTPAPAPAPAPTPAPDVAAHAPNNRTGAFDIAILCVNGAEIARLTRAIGSAALQGRYRIGLWFWELEQLTPEMATGLEHLDEVWVTSEFVANAVRDAAPPNFPVHILPLGMDLPATKVRTETERAATRTRLGLPQDAAHGLVIGFAFDYASRIARKNPLGLVDAFIKAFPIPFSIGTNHGPWLVLKAFNPDATPQDADRVREAIARRPDIVSIQQHLSPEDQRAYVSSLDLVASLHRSEGYGLLMLEAMGQGIPTMATEYSGNLAFMNHGNAWLVPATRVTVDENAEPYPSGYTWAEPQVASAASTLRWIISGLTTSSSRAAADVSKRTNQSIIDTKTLLDGSAGAAFVRQRLAEIRANRN